MRLSSPRKIPFIFISRAWGFEDFLSPSHLLIFTSSTSRNTSFLKERDPVSEIHLKALGSYQICPPWSCCEQPIPPPWFLARERSYPLQTKEVFLYNDALDWFGNLEPSKFVLLRSKTFTKTKNNLLHAGRVKRRKSRWPVSAVDIAVSRAPASGISPITMMPGFWRSTARGAFLKFGVSMLISLRLNTLWWSIKSYSIGYSRVSTFSNSHSFAIKLAWQTL